MVVVVAVASTTSRNGSCAAFSRRRCRPLHLPEIVMVRTLLLLYLHSPAAFSLLMMRLQQSPPHLDRSATSRALPCFYL
ncbi:hypothetical protein SOVF_117960 [Spinacia oleracea]|nr:hypothetical protein SOVF_117960 [Spinacia oleracea]